MKKNRPYQATSVKNVSVAELIRNRDGMSCDVGLDVSKDALLVVVRWRNGSFERPWRVKLHELALLVEKLKELKEKRKVFIALEPTGTYCDPVRQALSRAGFKVYRVSPKASHDYAEIFDGVPSQHDGKDAACVAELSAIKKRSEWLWNSENQQLRHEIEWMDAQQRMLTSWLGQLEGLLGRYWPELTSLLELSSFTLLSLLTHYGGPENMAKDPEAAQHLRRWGGTKLKQSKIQKLIDSAANTFGVRQEPSDVLQVRRYAQEAMNARKQVKQSKQKLKTLIKGNVVTERIAEIVGSGTAAVFWAHFGNPAEYHCGKAFLKANGLNLKVRSSGRFKGQLKITKRGPSRPRRWLYFAALRYAQHAWISPWYQAKKARGQGYAKRALVALMRKLVLAMYHVAKGATFDVGTLLPGAKKYHDGKRSKNRSRQTVSA